MVSITNEKIGKGHIEEKREEAGRTGTCKYRPKSFLMMYEAVEAPLLNHKKRGCLRSSLYRASSVVIYIAFNFRRQVYQQLVYINDKKSVLSSAKISSGSEASEIVLRNGLLQILFVQPLLLIFDDSLNKVLLVLQELLPLPRHCRSPSGHPFGCYEEEGRDEDHQYQGVPVIIGGESTPEASQGSLESIYRNVYCVGLCRTAI